MLFMEININKHIGYLFDVLLWYLALINQAGDQYGRILKEVVRTDRRQ